MSKLIFLLAGFVFIMTSACRSEFERIRTSGEPELLYKKAFVYYDEGEYQKAQTLLELVVSAYRGRQESEEIYFRYAYTYYHLEQYLLASYYFKNFSQTYSTSKHRQEADFMDAYSNYQLSPTFRLDQTYTQKAIDGFQLFINTYPDSDRVQECNRLIDELRAKLERKAFEEGNLYFDLRRYQSAIHTYENLLKDFPETTNAEEVRYKILRANYLLAENSVLDKQPERYRETMTLANEFMDRYGEDSEFLKEVSNIKENSQKKLNQIDNV